MSQYTIIIVPMLGGNLTFLAFLQTSYKSPATAFVNSLPRSL